MDYKTVHEFGSDEYIVEKSKFIGYAKPIKSEDDAKEFIAEIKEKHKDATHNVWAYTVGLNMNIQRFSDDGEPSGTAGIPVLEVIKKEDLRDVVVVVTRYFGGVKLGAGGLVRAYTKGAKIGLDSAKKVLKKMYTHIFVELNYNLLGKFQNEVANREIHIADMMYEDNVKVELLVENERIEEVTGFVTELSSATAKISLGEEEYISTIDGEIVE